VPTLLTELLRPSHVDSIMSDVGASWQQATLSHITAMPLHGFAKACDGSVRISDGRECVGTCETEQYLCDQGVVVREDQVERAGV
jgi:hypothetical protein